MARELVLYCDQCRSEGRETPNARSYVIAYDGEKLEIELAEECGHAAPILALREIGRVHSDAGAGNRGINRQSLEGRIRNLPQNGTE